MKKGGFLRILWLRLQKSIGSGGFWLSVWLTFLACMCETAYTDYLTAQQMSVWQVLFKLRREERLSAFEFSADSLMNVGCGNWISMFIPIIAAFACVPMLCAEVRSGALRFILPRSGKNRFYFARMGAALLMGGLSVALGYALFCLTVCILSPPTAAYSAGLQQLIADLHPEQGSMQFAALRLAEVFLYGVMAAAPALLCTCVTSNPYLVLCIPFLFRYILTQSSLKWMMDAYQDWEHPNVGMGNLAQTVNPDSLLTAFENVQMRNNVLWYNGTLLVLMVLLYIVVQRRRLDCGE